MALVICNINGRVLTSSTLESKYSIGIHSSIKNSTASFIQCGSHAISAGKRHK